MEEDIITSRRKDYFDHNYMQDTDSSCSQEIISPLPDLSPQSLEWGFNSLILHLYMK